MSENPFLSQERLNFPAFSPMFAASGGNRTASPHNEAGEFKWSIDHLALLKPADIATDPVSLSITNGITPDSKPDPREEKSIEKFFAQKSILPSPWMPTKAPVKRVTFSPHPPTTTLYERDESCLTSSPKGMMDAVTQTSMSIPTNVNLEQLLGPIFYFGEDANTSLRRKLFGQPQRTSFEDISDGQSKSSSSCGSGTCMSPDMHHQDSVSPLTAMSCSFGYLSPSISPAIFLKTPKGHSLRTREQLGGEDGEELLAAPLESSFATKLPVCNLTGISPISMATPAKDHSNGSLVRPTIATDQAPSCEADLLKELYATARDSLEKDAVKSDTKLRKGCPPSMCLQKDPMVAASSTPDSPPSRQTLADWLDIDHCPERLTGARKATSTPKLPKSGAVLKRQLVASPFASPVLKQQCIHRKDKSSSQQSSTSSDTGPSILSLGDLQTDLSDLTHVTSTACTSSFTHMKIDDDDANDEEAETEEVKKEKGMMEVEGRPIHSIMTRSQWRPPKHSTMLLDQAKEAESTTHTQHQSACMGLASLPSLSVDSGMASADTLHHLQASATSIPTLTVAKCHHPDAMPFVLPPSGDKALKLDANEQAFDDAIRAVGGTRKTNPHAITFSTSTPSSKTVDSALSMSDDSEVTSTPELGIQKRTASDAQGLNPGHHQVPTWTNATPSKWLSSGAGSSGNTLQQILAGKKNPPAFATSVALLPSRVRVTAHGSSSSRSSSSSPSTSPSRQGGRESLTPSGRNIGSRSGYVTSVGTSGQFPQELLSKKCFLKSRLKFSPIQHTNISLSSSPIGTAKSLTNDNDTGPSQSGEYYNGHSVTAANPLTAGSLKPHLLCHEPVGSIATSTTAQYSSIQATALCKHHTPNIPLWLATQVKNGVKGSPLD